MIQVIKGFSVTKFSGSHKELQKRQIVERIKLTMVSLFIVPDQEHDHTDSLTCSIMQTLDTCIIDVDLLLAWGATFHELEKGQVLFCEDDRAHFYYQVVKGKIKMCNCNEDGKEFIQGFFEAGESFGEPPLFDEGTYPASAEADEASVVIRLRKENFLQLLKENFEVHYCFTKLLAKRLRFKSLISKEISSYGPLHRVSTLLQEYKKNRMLLEDGLLKVDLTRQQIADMTGLRVETVIRSIRELQKKGELKIERGKVFC